MAQIIEDIISTDKNAREIVQKARVRREQILTAAEADRARIIHEGEERLSRLKASLVVENEAFEKNLAKTTEQNLAEKKGTLDEIYNNNEAAWVNDIFTKLTAAE